MGSWKDRIGLWQLQFSCPRLRRNARKQGKPGNSGVHGNMGAFENPGSNGASCNSATVQEAETRRCVMIADFLPLFLSLV